MSKSTPAVVAASKEVLADVKPAVKPAEPVRGGSFVRDLETGALVEKVTPSADQPTQE
ncbi:MULTISPECIES: hypothetical protein [unclassified Duganella]|jgi:hypothetical protein|uniref:hypothetical protein n=1 Tax=unclassified Duganella TaxID=2636909 RepID=UPI0008809462|nr:MULTISPECIES: hypothetical protein [unclassified Duganella]SDH40855.1 hypothetical protein SAMN05216320_1134 [Duganella sp. OV458]SDK61252.1 hypothetical protein SAMN05428973_113159 [Duganella sp. OV510]